jgi:hypothetical protein
MLTICEHPAALLRIEKFATLGNNASCVGEAKATASGWRYDA